MIQIVCIKCQAALSIDDGFAGGVCRCMHCGTMQSVPKAGRAGERPATIGGSAPKELYSPSRRGSEGGGRELSPSDVSGSGLSGSGIGSGIKGGAGKSAPAGGDQMKYLLYGAGGLIALLAGVAGWLLLGKSDKPAAPAESTPAVVATTPAPSNTAAVKPPPVEEAPAATGPSFCGLDLPDASVIYLVDRSGFNADLLASVKRAIGKSIDSLHTDQEFQIILWNSQGDAGIKRVPATGLTRAIPAASADATAQLESESQAAVGTIVESDAAPESAAIAQPDFSAKTVGNKQDFSDNGGPPGQTFTPTADLTLKAITVKGFSNSSQNLKTPVGKVTLTISRIDPGDVMVRVAQESMSGGFTRGGAYQTLPLTKPVKLSAGKTYAYDIFTASNFYGFAKSAKDVYPGGMAIQHGTTARTSADKAKVAATQPTVDRTFFINPKLPGEGKSAMELALAARPAVVVLVTSKLYDDNFAAQVQKSQKGEPVKIDVVRVGGPPSTALALRKITGAAKGQYVEISEDKVHQAGN